MRLLRELWRLLDRRQRRRLLGLQVVAVVMALSTVGGIAAVLPFLTVLSEPHAIHGNAALATLYGYGGFTDERSFTVALGAAFALLVLVSNAVNLFGSLAMNRFAYRIGDAFGVALLDEYLRRDYAFHVRTHSSRLVSNVVNETARVATGILRGALLLSSSLVTMVLILVSMLLVNPPIAVGALAALASSYALVYALSRRRLASNGRIESLAFGRRGQVVGESFGALKEILLHHAQGLFVERFARLTRSISATIVNTMAVAQTPRPVLETLTLICLVGAALFLSGGAHASEAWLAQLSFTGLAAYRLLPAMQQGFGALVRMRADAAAFENIAADLHQARERTTTLPARAAKSSFRGRPRREVRLCGVSFRHADAAAPLLHEVSLRIPAGSLVGLTGANGSGKTTLVDLVAGLLIPESGHIRIDGIALDSETRAEWQAAIAYVPQESVLLDATLAENIAFGVARERIDAQRLHLAARLARLEQCIATLPRGFHEMLGERGVRLSGGQRQRVGIARALYRDASFLILDEVTSALDGLVEEELLAILQDLRQRCTIVLIAHRLTSLQRCDLVFELADGSVRITEGSSALRDPQPPSQVPSPPQPLRRADGPA